MESGDDMVPHGCWHGDDVATDIESEADMASDVAGDVAADISNTAHELNGPNSKWAWFQPNIYY